MLASSRYGTADKRTSYSSCPLHIVTLAGLPRPPGSERVLGDVRGIPKGKLHGLAIEADFCDIVFEDGCGWSELTAGGAAEGTHWVAGRWACAGGQRRV